MINPFDNRGTPILHDKWEGTVTQVAEKTRGKRFTVWSAAPCNWSRDRGATHTLIVEDDYAGGGTRPAKLLKTVMYVGVDEIDNDILWEKWSLFPSRAWWCESTYHHTMSPHHEAAARAGTTLSENNNQHYNSAKTTTNTTT